MIFNMLIVIPEDSNESKLKINIKHKSEQIDVLWQDLFYCVRGYTFSKIKLMVVSI